MNIKSENIKIYPTANRTLAKDYGANINLEQNINSLSNNVVDYSNYIKKGLDLKLSDNADYIVVYDGTCVIQGYSINIKTNPETFQYTQSDNAITFNDKTGYIYKNNGDPGSLYLTGSYIIYDNDTYYHDDNDILFYRTLNSDTIEFRQNDELNFSKYTRLSLENLDTTKTYYIYLGLNIHHDSSLNIDYINSIDNTRGEYEGLELYYRTAPTSSNQLELGQLSYVNNVWKLKLADKNVKFNAKTLQIELNSSSGLTNNQLFKGNFSSWLEDEFIVDDGDIQ